MKYDTLTKEQQKHTKNLAGQCVVKVKERWGSGWYLLGPELQEALIASEVLCVLRARSDGKPDLEKIEAIYEVAHSMR